MFARIEVVAMRTFMVKRTKDGRSIVVSMATPHSTTPAEHSLDSKDFDECFKEVLLLRML